MRTENRAFYSTTVIAGMVTSLLCAILAWQRPLFHDEASTWYFAGDTLAHLMEMLRQDIHPPLYFLIAWFWFMLVPAEAALPGLRLLSAMLMGASVTVFLQAVPRFTGSQVGRLSIVFVALSPFLIFCGYFARYYALACLLWTCCLWMIGRIFINPVPRYFWMLGVLYALLFLTNYAAALIAAISSIPLLLTLLLSRQWKSIMATIVPGALAVLVWYPVLAAQLLSDLPDRVGGIPSLMHLAKSSIFLIWTFAVSDGMPPWHAINVLLAGVLIIAAAFSVLKAPNHANPGICLLSVISILTIFASVIIGWLLLPGPMYSFLPPRVALCGFAWLTLLILLQINITPSNESGRLRRLLARISAPGIVAIHMFAAVQLIIGQKSTNWAYQVPNNQIAEAVHFMVSSVPGSAAVFLPEKSFRNIQYQIERSLAGSNPNQLIINPVILNESTRLSKVIVIRNPRTASWPPSAAISTKGVFDPPGNWIRERSLRFLEEDETASGFKSLFSDSEVFLYKIQMDVWMPSGISTQ